MPGKSASRRRKRRGGRLAPLLTALALIAAGAGICAIRRAARLPGEDVKLPDYVTEDFLDVNPYSRPGTALKKIRGVVIHYVGNPGTTAAANRDYFESLASGTDGTYASAHFVVGLDGEVIQCIPLTEISYASNSRNGDTVSIEVCHPDKSGKFSTTSYRRAVELTAYLCSRFQLDPEKDVIRHYDITGKICPKYYVEHPKAWNQFRNDVRSEMKNLI